MKPETACIVQDHDAHDRPRLYALHERGRLWYFDLCNPHVWPGSHWGVPDTIVTIADNAIVSQDLTGDERSIQATGYGLSRLRAEFCARFAQELSANADVAPARILIRRRRVLQDDGQSVLDPDWPPQLPTVRWTEGPDGICLYLDSLEDFRQSLDPNMVWREDVAIVFGESGSHRLEFERDVESWYLTWDDGSVLGIARQVADELNVELVENHESIAVHKPILILE